MSSSQYKYRSNVMDLIEKLVSLDRVCKANKGGRRFGFRALVIVGDGKGRVGYGFGKAREVSNAINKATNKAKKYIMRVPLREGRTLHHDVDGKHDSAKVHLRAAPIGTGIIAGGPMRSVFEALGMQDVVSKSIGKNSSINMIRATFDAFNSVLSPRDVAAKRGVKISDLVSRRRK